MKFIDIAKNLVEELNKSYSTALGDLEIIIGTLENSLKEILPELKFELLSLTDDFSGSVFRLTLDANPEDNQVERTRITDFNIPSNGYPICTGNLRRKDEDFNVETYLHTKEDIENYFGSLVNSNDSRIIQSIGFALRRKKNNEKLPF